MSAQNIHSSLSLKFLLLLPLVAAVPRHAIRLAGRASSDLSSVSSSVVNVSPSAPSTAQIDSGMVGESGASTSVVSTIVASPASMAPTVRTTASVLYESAASSLPLGGLGYPTSVTGKPASGSMFTAVVSTASAVAAYTPAESAATNSATTVALGSQSQGMFTYTSTFCTFYLSGTGGTTGTSAGIYGNTASTGSIATDGSSTSRYPLVYGTGARSSAWPAHTGESTRLYGIHTGSKATGGRVHATGALSTGASPTEAVSTEASAAGSASLAYTVAKPTQTGTAVLPAGGKQTCDGSAALVCSSDGTMFGICDGTSALMLAVAVGTKCGNGSISWT